jgi:hypothetical protein
MTTTCWTLYFCSVSSPISIVPLMLSHSPFNGQRSKYNPNEQTFAYM